MTATFRAALFVAFAALAAPVAAAQPIIKVINFTADWCPNCQIVDPRLAEAISRFPEGEIEYVELDLTQTRRTDEDTKAQVIREAIATADRHGAGYLWDWYGGLTGISVIISADNGEPISCVMRVLEVDDIAYRLTEAKILSLRAPAGRRKPNGPDCPAPDDI